MEMENRQLESKLPKNQVFNKTKKYCLTFIGLYFPFWFENWFRLLPVLREVQYTYQHNAIGSPVRLKASVREEVSVTVPLTGEIRAPSVWKVNHETLRSRLCCCASHVAPYVKPLQALALSQAA